MHTAEFGYGNTQLAAQLSPHSTQPKAFELDTAVVTKTPWTTARCSRLLRPLSSKIALLRKEKQFEHRRSKQGPEISILDNRCGIESCGGRDVGEPQKSTQSTHTTIRDEAREWESSSRPRKRVKRTYSSKSQSFISRNECGGHEKLRYHYGSDSTVIELPTQLSLEPKPVRTSVASKDCIQAPLPSSRGMHPSHELPKSMAPKNWKLAHGICKGYLALLKTTDCGKWVLYRKGCRSLLSTCLRQVPSYIAEEELVSKTHDPKNEDDISAIVYNDLEEFRSVSGGGWESLRELVRAHATKMITDAIEEGLLEVGVARHLFHVCLDTNAYEEAERIIESLTNLARPSFNATPGFAQGRPEDLHTTIISLASLAVRTDRNGFLFRHTAAMHEEGLFSREWMSSKAMVQTWNEVVRSITQGDEDVELAALLLQTAVAVSCKATNSCDQEVDKIRILARNVSHRPILRSARTNQAVENMDKIQPTVVSSNRLPSKTSESEEGSNLSNVLTVLSAVARLQIAASPQSIDRSSIWAVTVLRDLALEATRAIELSELSRQSHQPPQSHMKLLQLPLLAAVLAELPLTRLSKDVPPHSSRSLAALARFSMENNIFKGTGSFICAVARCCGRARSEDIFSVTKGLVQDLITTSQSTWVFEQSRTFCSDLAIAAAFSHAEDTGRPAHLDWALQVESSITGKGVGTPKPAIMKTPTRGDRHIKSGFRWEEGICEWIAKTPNLLLQKSGEAPLEAEDLGETPLAICSVVKKALPLMLESSLGTVSKDAIEETDRRESGQAKALHVLIQAGTGSRSSVIAAKHECFKRPQSSKKNRAPDLNQTIFKDNDLDELSVTGSSQEWPPALSTLPEPPNAVVNTTRKRRSARQQNMKAVDASRLDGNENGVQLTDHREQLESVDSDELASLFKW